MKVNIGKYPGARSKKPRKVDIQIDPWDTWNADQTLALIAVPLLKQLKTTKHGSPYVDDEDVPENLRSYNSEQIKDEHIDSNHHNRWDWVLSEIVYSMQEISDNLSGENIFYDHSQVKESDSFLEQIKAIKVDQEGRDAYNARVQNGCRLMGKYFMNLWS